MLLHSSSRFFHAIEEVEEFLKACHAHDIPYFVADPNQKYLLAFGSCYFVGIEQDTEASTGYVSAVSHVKDDAAASIEDGQNLFLLLIAVGRIQGSSKFIDFCFHTCLIMRFMR